MISSLQQSGRASQLGELEARDPPLLEPADQGSESDCHSPAQCCPSRGHLQPHAAAGAPAPPISVPFSQHRLSSACGRPGAELTAGFHPGTKTPSKIFPGLCDACCRLGSAHHRGIWQPARAGGLAVFDRTCHLPDRDLCLPRRLATRRAASAKPARRCLPPSAAGHAELSCPGKSPLAASQAPGAGARLPAAAARGGGERGRG